MGDPGGVGPEVIVQSIVHHNVIHCCIPVIIGDVAVLHEAVALTGLALEIKKIAAVWEVDDKTENIVHVLEPTRLETFTKRESSIASGRAVYEYIKQAVQLTLEKKASALVTAPISKTSLKLAGFHWPGHTELLAELTQTTDYAMMLVGGPLRVILSTIHIALKDVSAQITQQNVLKTIRLANQAASMLGIPNPAIGVAGLNPHAGESGIFGDEEIKAIQPAIEQAKKEGLFVSGPFPPDVIFYKAYHGQLDIVCAMYHDQGLIPLKMIAFESGVNLTIGLPIIRTSPDHGTAFDIAWQNKANPSSMIEAIKLAAFMGNKNDASF
jgi:4-hydroxythreonine-4-phosphate dehydrogenase